MNLQLLEQLRQEAIASPRRHNAYEECVNDRPVEYRTYLTFDKEMLEDERCMGVMLKEKLKAMRFKCLKGEPLVGRLDVSEGVTPELRQEAREYFRTHEIKWGASSGQSGHCAPDYDKILNLGLDGLREEVEAARRRSSLPLHDNMMAAIEGLETMIGHAADAAELAGNLEVAVICRKLQHRPPKTFHEGLQLILLVQIAIEKGERAYLINPGRLDRTLARFLPVASHDEMVWLIGFFYLIINYNCVWGLAYGVMICGETPANEISYACLEATRLSRLPYPTVGICVNGQTPDDLMELAVSIVAEGNPNPAFFGDETIRKGLESYGIPHETSGNYINSTCVEITPCGQSNVYVASPYFNLSQILLDSMDCEYTSFDELMESYHRHLAEKIREASEGNAANRADRAKRMRRPLQSLLTADCLEKGLDIECGGARYNWIECSFVGLANLVDSLTVIRREVFGKKRLTLLELRRHCEQDFENAEPLRQEFIKCCPKYGHANPEVDSLINPLMAFIRSELAKYRFFPNDSPWIPGTFCWEMHQRLGAQTCATPDGRKAGFPFADGAGPAQGRETFGPTTAIRSVTSWDHTPLVGGSAFNMKFSKACFADAEAREKLLALIKTFIQQGGFETQINVVDPEVLIDADKHPEAYPDLLVRIGGYSDFFARLSPGMRKEVIMRTQNEL